MENPLKLDFTKVFFRFTNDLIRYKNVDLCKSCVFVWGFVTPGKFNSYEAGESEKNIPCLGLASCYTSRV